MCGFACQRNRVQFGSQFSCRVLCGRATQCRPPRRPRLAALLTKRFVPHHAHDLRWAIRLLAHRLTGRRVAALPHLRVAVENLESWPVDDANDDVAAFDRAVSKTRALDPAADALVFRALV